MLEQYITLLSILIVLKEIIWLIYPIGKINITLPQQGRKLHWNKLLGNYGGFYYIIVWLSLLWIILYIYNNWTFSFDFIVHHNMILF